MAACTDATGVDETTGVEPDALTGTWTSTSFVLTSVANPSMTMDLVAEEGALLTLVLGADGAYTFTFTSTVEPTENETGTYTVSGNIMTVIPVTPAGLAAEVIGIVRVGDTLTLTLDDEVVFTDGGNAEAAVLVIVLTR
jgi:hypothetical protein